MIEAARHAATHHSHGTEHQPPQSVHWSPNSVNIVFFDWKPVMRNRRSINRSPSVRRPARHEPDRNHHRDRADRRGSGVRRQSACSAARTAATTTSPRPRCRRWRARSSRSRWTLAACRQPAGTGHAAVRCSGWLGPYAKEAELKDPWGHPIEYRTPGESGAFDLVILGKDGKIGGTSVDADIKYQ
jgi:hypothetical protein